MSQSHPPFPQQSDRQRKLVAMTILGVIVVGLLVVLVKMTHTVLTGPKLPTGTWVIKKANCRTGELTLADPCRDSIEYEVKLDVGHLNTKESKPVCRDISRETDGLEYRPAGLLVNPDGDYTWIDQRPSCGRPGVR